MRLYVWVFKDLRETDVEIEAEVHWRGVSSLVYRQRQTEALLAIGEVVREHGASSRSGTPSCRKAGCSRDRGTAPSSTAPAYTQSQFWTAGVSTMGLSRLAEPARAVPVAAAPRVAEASRPAAAPFSDSWGERDAGRVRRRRPRDGRGFRRQARRVVRRVSSKIAHALPDVPVLVDDGRLRSADPADPTRIREQRISRQKRGRFSRSRMALPREFDLCTASDGSLVRARAAARRSSSCTRRPSYRL